MQNVRVSVDNINFTDLRELQIHQENGTMKVRINSMQLQAVSYREPNSGTSEIDIDLYASHLHGIGNVDRVFLEEFGSSPALVLEWSGRAVKL